MTRHKVSLMVAGALAIALLNAPALAEPQQIKGIIVSNDSGQLTVKTPAGNQTVQLGADALVRSISGPLGGQKEQVPATSLIAGLPVTIEADDATGQLVASNVEYKASDYKTAAQIQAGVEATAAKTEEAVAALSRVGEWNVRAETAVYFKSGSVAISPAGKKALAGIASQAQGYQGYMISVLGYADPTGNAAANQRLSNQRAQNVINVLKQSSGIQPGRVLSASAMGEVKLNGAANPSSYASERRVNVRVLTSAAQLPAQ